MRPDGGRECPAADDTDGPWSSGATSRRSSIIATIAVLSTALLAGIVPVSCTGEIGGSAVPGADNGGFPGHDPAGGASGGKAAQGGNGGGGASGGAAGSGSRDAGGSGADGPGTVNGLLVVDAPASGQSIGGSVVVRGRAAGFANVEAWDQTHQKPPLGHAVLAADGSFSFTVNLAGLPVGPTQWTIWAWDTPPGVTATRSASVPLSLTIVPAGSGGAGGRVGSGGISGTGGRGGTGAGGGGGPSGGETVGGGSVDAPARGPGPSEAAQIGGGAFILVKNWNFGASGTIGDIASLSAEFMYHDQFGTIANGTNYGAITVAPNAATAIQGQPVEDPSRPYRVLTADTMMAFVRPLSASQSTVTVSAHDAGNGSMTAKWTLPGGGKLLGKDLLWETRARMPAPAAAYWFAIWTAGNKWNKGAEVDVLESFGTPNIYPPPAAFHVNSVGGTDTIDYASWPNGLNTAGVPAAGRDLREWHTWSWLYRKDDTYVVYFDGHVVQSGTIHWTLGGTPTGEAINMSFLFDLGWGHTQIPDVNISLPASTFGITYEIDYSRAYLR